MSGFLGRYPAFKSGHVKFRSIHLVRSQGASIQGIHPKNLRLRFRHNASRSIEYRYPDQLLLFSVLFLVACGLLMVFSSSSVISLHERADPLFYFRRHLARVVIGGCLMVGLIFVDYRRVLKTGPWACLISAILLVIVLIPGIGILVQGGRRWLDLGLIRFQPSELFKLTYVIFLSHSLSQISSCKRPFVQMIVPHLITLAVCSGLILKQPNLSTSALILFTGICMIVMVYQKRWFIFSILAALPAALAYFIWSAPYRLRRITAFLNPFENQQDSGYQIIQSYVSLGSGGLFGLGLGQSRQKFFYLPEEHTDFIFAVLGEEFGFVGCLVVILAFAVLIGRGLAIAIKITDPAGKLLAFGLVIYLFTQILINLGVVSGIAPPTGVPLPFVSYGGSSLIINMAAAGILLNLSRHCSEGR